jgi:hypothetical protein
VPAGFPQVLAYQLLALVLVFLEQGVDGIEVGVGI